MLSAINLHILLTRLWTYKKNHGDLSLSRGFTTYFIAARCAMRSAKLR